MKSLQKRYIELSDEFRDSNASKESIEKLYDFLYELEEAQKPHETVIILSYVYSLLGYHQSAYETFQSAVDLKDRKVLSKLFALQQMSETHKNNFVIKDIRKLRKKNEQTVLSNKDFAVSDSDVNKFNISGKDLVVFNKVVEGENVEIYFPDNKIEKHFEQFQRYLDWLNFCKEELILFYNQWIEDFDYIDENADDDWYDTLEVFSVQITIEEDRSIHARISGSDEFNTDHILDIETYGNEIVSMSYDG